MRSPLTIAAACVAGGLTGGLVGSILWAPPPAPEPAPAPPAVVAVELDAPLPSACPARAAVLAAETARLEGALAAVALQQRILDVRRVQREGAESPWPAEPDPSLRPEVWRAALEEALAEVGGELLELECDEYPCVTAVKVPKEDDFPGVYGGSLDPLKEALAASGYPEHEAWITSMTGLDGAYMASFAMLPVADDALATRMSFRVGRVFEEVSSSLEEP